MADDVKITFSADISDLQRGLAEAADGIAATQAVLKAGADKVGASFAALTQAYAAGTARRLDLVKEGSDDELSIARSGEKAQTDIALDVVKLKQSSVKEGRLNSTRSRTTRSARRCFSSSPSASRSSCSI